MDEDPEFPHLEFAQSCDSSRSKDLDDDNDGIADPLKDEDSDNHCAYDGDSECDMRKVAADTRRSWKPKRKPTQFQALLAEPECEPECEFTRTLRQRDPRSFVQMAEARGCKASRIIMKPKRRLRKKDSLEDNTKDTQQLPSVHY